MVANGHSSGGAISSDGRFVAFTSGASNIVPNDNNHRYDTFVRDLVLSETIRISVASDGWEGTPRTGSAQPLGSEKVSISSDGGYVAFSSSATYLVANDTNDKKDIFVYVMATGEIERVSVSSTGQEGDDTSYGIPAISADGRYIAFSSNASNLAPGVGDSDTQIYIRDRLLGTTELLSAFAKRPSITPDGRYVAFLGGTPWGVRVRDRQTEQTFVIGAEGFNGAPSISNDGRYIAFSSPASNLVSGDSNGTVDVFVHDRLTVETTRVSVSSNGNESPDGAGNFDYETTRFMSADGRYVTFTSGEEGKDSHLVPGDHNGPDALVHDRVTGETVHVAAAYDGSLTNGGTQDSSITLDGKYIVFKGSGTNLIPDYSPFSSGRAQWGIYRVLNPLWNSSIP